jgi:hypothetical protein
LDLEAVHDGDDRVGRVFEVQVRPDLAEFACFGEGGLGDHRAQPRVAAAEEVLRRVAFGDALRRQDGVRPDDAFPFGVAAAVSTRWLRKARPRGVRYRAVRCRFHRAGLALVSGCAKRSCPSKAQVPVAELADRQEGDPAALDRRQERDPRQPRHRAAAQAGRSDGDTCPYREPSQGPSRVGRLFPTGVCHLRSAGGGSRAGRCRYRRCRRCACVGEHALGPARRQERRSEDLVR